jgi:TonB C terminal
MLSRIAVTETTRRTRHPGVVLVGALGSLALHALLLAPVVFGGGMHQHATADAPGTARSVDRPGAQGAIAVEFIEEIDGRATASARGAISLPPSPSTLTRPAALDLIPPSDIPDIETERDAPSSAAGPSDESLAAQFYGMYMGQISARIERAWLKPRTSPGADRFVCRVQVLQTPSGDVQEVTLLDCNGDVRWRSSLVRAIQTASPLPAPPDARVFRKHITLRFASDAFVAGGSSEGFEPEVLTAMLNVRGTSAASGNATSAQASSANTPAPDNMVERLRSMRDGEAGAVDLRISGSVSQVSDQR